MSSTYTLFLHTDRTDPLYLLAAPFTRLADLGPGTSNPKPEGGERERVGGDEEEDEAEPETIPDGPKPPGPGTGPQQANPETNHTGDRSWMM